MKLGLRARAAAALAALAGSALALALSMPACRSIIVGSDEDHMPAVEKFCDCWEEITPPVFHSRAECIGIVEGRLEVASDTTLAAWLTKFAKDCSGACSTARECYYTRPLCESTVCSIDQECCSFDGDAGTCNEAGLCAPDTTP